LENKAKENKDIEDELRKLKEEDDKELDSSIISAY
jgi:hypothetical protein